MLYCFLWLAASLALELSNEWVKITGDEAIPAGMDVQLNMETGERFVRLAQPVEGNDTPHELATITPDIDELFGKLDALEELAHDIDRGEEIMRSHFLQLDALSHLDDPRADQANKIIQTALRHNQRAAKAVLEQDTSYPWKLIGDVSHLTWRRLGIYSSLISTEFGRQACFIHTNWLLDKLGDIPWDDKLVKRFDSLTQDMFHMDAKYVDSWGVAIENAVLKAPSKELLEIFASFQGMHPIELSSDFLQWLSQVAYENTPLGGYARTVRHKVFGNEKADRLHLDL